ncbi:hypothetical protein B0H14DRAFT_3498770 [Mycena olivaceomarginata]|nr:hypothetical protein B0H14DRAFT_3498770 [Mycena olivaceomarginata]
MGKWLKAPDSESIDELEARVQEKAKALKTGAEGDTTIDTPTDANAKEVMPSKELKPAK